MEAEALDGGLEEAEAEAKEKLTTVPSLVCTLATNDSEFHVCLSVCLFADFLTKIRQLWGSLPFLMRYLSDFFLRHSWDLSTLVPNHSEFLVCVLVC